MSSWNSPKVLFRNAMVSDALLAKAMTWIGENMKPEDVFPEDKLKKWAGDHLICLISEEKQ